MENPIEVEKTTDYQFDDFDAIGIAEGFIESDDENQIIAAWQYIKDKRLYLGLQGFFGRMVENLTEQGILIVMLLLPLFNILIEQ